MTGRQRSAEPASSSGTSDPASSGRDLSGGSALAGRQGDDLSGDPALSDRDLSGDPALSSRLDGFSGRDAVESLLEIAGLSYAYPGSSDDVLSGITLDVSEGEFVSVVGPSGCGKSTLLSAAAGLITGYRGSIRFRGEQITRPNPGIGVVFQEDATFPWRTTLRNVEFGLEMRGMGKAERRRKATEMLALVGLEKFAHYYPHQLSGGMKQRVAIARTLVTGPDLLLMDEPFGALDEQTRMLLGEELLRIQQELRQTVLFVTHSIQESIMLSDRVVLMSRGPGRIKDVITVGFPRPRNPDLISTPEFGALTAQAWNSIREESLRINLPSD
jgi:NitT/TauT family transport system ATP-binding protein